MVKHAGLVIQFADDFSEVGPLNPYKWAKLEHAELDLWPSDERISAERAWQAWQERDRPRVRTTGTKTMQRVDIRCEGGSAVISASTLMPPGPAVMAYGGFSTRKKHFNPGLSGTNVLEVSLASYTAGGEFLNRYLNYYGNPSDIEDPVGGRYTMGWGLSIGTFPGFITGNEDGAVERAVQLHFDGWSRYGWSTILCRNVVPGDVEKYSEFNHETETYEGKPKPFIAQPCVILSSSRDFSTEGDSPAGHRLGIRLTDHGNTLSWTLDGRVMDTVDISGFFQSSPVAVREGAHASICVGGSYQDNIWKFSGVEVHVSD